MLDIFFVDWYRYNSVWFGMVFFDVQKTPFTNCFCNTEQKNQADKIGLRHLFGYRTDYLIIRLKQTNSP